MLLLNDWWPLLAVAILIVAGLAFYLGQLLFQIKHQQKAQQKALADAQHKWAERQQYLLDSITLIAKAALEQQCEYSEAALRIWVLLENYQPELAQACRFPGLFALYDCVKAMPTHEARNELDKKELRHLDHVREQAEIQLHDSMTKDLQELLNQLQARH